MNEQERFDELLRSKLSEREFPFDELSWDEAERLIIKQERWSNIKKVALVFSAGLIIGMALMLPFILGNHSVIPNTTGPNKGNPGQNQNLASHNPGIVQTQPGQESASNNTTNNVGKSSQPVQSAFVKKNRSTGQKATPANSSPIADVPKGSSSLSAVGEGWKHKSSRRRQASPTIVASAGPTRKTRKQNKINSQDVPAVVSSSSPKTDASNSLNKIDNTNTDITASNPTVATNVVTTTTNEPTTSNPTPAKTTIPDIKPMGNPGDTVHGKFVIAKTNVAVAPLPHKDSNISNAGMIRGRDLISGAGDFKPSIYLFVNAGGDYSPGSSINGDKEAYGLTPWGGGGLGYHFSPKLSATVGADYDEIINLNKTYTGNIIEYDFGANSSVTTVTPKSVSYLRFPLSLQIKINDKSMFTGGLDYLMLLTTSSTVNSYQVNYLGQESNKSSQTQTPYVQRFYNNNFQFNVAYTWMPFKRFGINFEGYYGIGYIENNSFPFYQYLKNNSGFRIFFSYQFMK